MTIHEASRTLLKSPPELWAECSDATSLSRHLDQFGEIKITRLEPETAVAWEGENVSGTVKLEPSGWGTRVILTAEEVDPVIEGAPPAPESDAAPEGEPVSAPEAECVAAPATESVAEQAEPEPELAAPEADPELAVPEATVEPDSHPLARGSQPQPEPEPKMGFFARLFGRKRSLVWPQVEPISTAVEPEPAAEPEPTPAPEFEPEPEPAPQPTPEPGLQASEPDPEPTPDTTSEPAAPTPDATIRALTDALESLGMAHHRPFSRS